ncbi:hypothetical protein [Halorussus sp. MSC15.2]|uniref:hypothetical protein n=1 Tax=Halorussus sp. MSC15.2 TaxID=2283638 RepID=UPI0013D589B3|nr:hypothetical protein [Halorussus sp. MSC15.2]NEU59213.1 hypothetical protein [Halorussus sp. MSC15.2]
MSNRDYDHKNERKVGRFLDEYLYENLDWRTERQTETDIQRQGSDIIASIPGIGSKIHIDEKAQTDYLNNPLPTFALEIDSIQNGTKRKGWLFKPDKNTDYYLFIWMVDVYAFRRKQTRYGEKILIERGDHKQLKIDADALPRDTTSVMWRDEASLRADDDVDNDDLPGPRVEIDASSESIDAFESNIVSIPGRITSGGTVDRRAFEAEHINEIECLLVDRDTLQDYLAAAGFDRTTANDKATELRNRNNYGKTDVNAPDFYFYYTSPRQKNEEPINIVMYRRQLEQLAEETYTVTQNGIQ